jgi:tRNA threonylcarbamoyladenosine biosynthesis protein TsaE
VNFLCKTKSDLVPAATKLLKAYPSARVFAFYGKMGVGKTTFIKVLCKLLGAVDIVQSPSFSIINEYKTFKGESVFHFDFYRIKKPEEAFDIGYEDYFYSGFFCFIEWPEHIEELLPEGTIKVSITGESERLIEF